MWPAPHTSERHLPPAHPPSSFVADRLARRRLGVASVVFFVVAAAAPLTVIAGAAVTAVAVTEITAVPVGYLVVAIGLAVFAVGYVAMSRHVVNAGAFYSYVSHGLGRTFGVSAAAVALVAYNAMQVGLYGAFGYVGSLVLGAFGVTVAWWPCALVGWAIVAILGLLDVSLNGRVLATMLAAEVLIVLIYDAAMITHPAGGALRFDTLQPDQLLTPDIAAVMVVSVAGFVGFEATVVFSEEARDPRRTVARATYIAIAVIGLLYGLSAWALSVATGPEHLVARAKSEGPDLMFNLVLPYVGQSLVDLGKLLFLTSLFAALLVFHHTVARYSYALGRERVLPAAFGRVVRRTGAPKVGSLAQSILALGVIGTYAVAGWHPMENMFALLTTTGGLGVLILMAATSVSVIGFFSRDPRGESIWHRLIAPVAASLFLGGLTIDTIIHFGSLLAPASSQWVWGFPIAYGIAMLGGLVWAFIVRRWHADIYARIGLGVEEPPGSPKPPEPSRHHAVI
ncbi:amino acid/polyamine/organocation transporter (APC superfamily) [Asanoa ferruginea]|uniref:Amino acid/polyamine/organocation transporter (APC superfamily) n=1 Tax=Asanoa ferruginea TaxID=53367 RepID=A0A3D9ZDM8_9ACTN|nr:amino acid/polyamine/organocation transporter (APC superfamily) [Asanoa ferruginea]